MSDKNVGLSIIEKVEAKGSITLDELIEGLTKNGVTDIQFNDLSLNIEKILSKDSDKESSHLFDNGEIESFGVKIMEDALNIDTDSKDDNLDNLNKVVSSDRDYKLLDCVIEGNFEIEDAERILSLIDVNKIKKYIIEKLENDEMDLKNLVYILMDLRGR